MSIVQQINGDIVPIVSIDGPHVIVPRVETTGQSWLQRMWNGFLVWHEKREGRRALHELTGDQLKDIGLSQSDAAREVGKSTFWD